MSELVNVAAHDKTRILINGCIALIRTMNWIVFAFLFAITEKLKLEDYLHSGVCALCFVCQRIGRAAVTCVWGVERNSAHLGPSLSKNLGTLGVLQESNSKLYMGFSLISPNQCRVEHFFYHI